MPANPASTVLPGEEEPQVQRRRLIRNAARCGKCGDVIESKHRHDAVFCSCGALFVDGGLDYTRRGGAIDDMEELSEWAPEAPSDDSTRYVDASEMSEDARAALHGMQAREHFDIGPALTFDEALRRGGDPSVVLEGRAEDVDMPDWVASAASHARARIASGGCKPGDNSRAVVWLADELARLRGSVSRADESTERETRLAESLEKLTRASATLRAENDRLHMLLQAYRDKRACDGLNGRDWDALRHYEAEQDVVHLEAKMASRSTPPETTA